jgi:hypothetical protein
MSRQVLLARVISHQILLGRVTPSGGKLIARATCMLLLYRTGQWITALLYISTARMLGKQVYATIEALMLSIQAVHLGLGNAPR